MRLVPIIPIILMTTAAGIATGQLLGRDVPQPLELSLKTTEIELQYSDVFDINRCIPQQGTERGLQIRLPAQLSGRVYYGPWELEADPPRPRLRKSTRLRDGEADLNLASLMNYPNDIADFDQRQEGDVALQFEIWDPDAAEVMVIRRTVHFRFVDGRFQRALTFVEEPFYSCEVSDGVPVPVISFAADRPVDARVLVEKREPYLSPRGQRRHEVRLTGLPPESTHLYSVEITAQGETTRSRNYTFRAPPLPGGTQPFTAILLSDCRAGVGAGEQSVEGVNHAVLQQLLSLARAYDPGLILFPGDLVNGWTDQPDAYRRQLRSFKRAVGSTAGSIPLFTGMGNHESLLDFYDDGSRWGVALDRMPYATQSAEALFAAEFANPGGGPPPESAAAPPYDETVYALPWGEVLFIMLNSNYWFSTHPEQYGGNVEGGMLDAQLAWLREQVNRAQADPAVRWIVYATHEPTFPNGGHLHDAMWYNGGAPADNRGRDRREVIERRDRWWSIVAGASKSLLVVHGDEHNYCRMLVDAETSVYADGSGNPAFRYPVWQIVSGGAGAPYYTQADTPWRDSVIRFSTQQHFVAVEFNAGSAYLRTVAASGQVIDEDELSRIRPAHD